MFINNLPSFNDINNDNSNINNSKIKNNNSIYITYDININNINTNEHLNKDEENHLKINQINKDINNNLKKGVIPIIDNINKENFLFIKMKIFFLVILLLKRKEGKLMMKLIMKSNIWKLIIHNYNKRKIILFSDEEKVIKKN